jgi:hypothetical protein
LAVGEEKGMITFPLIGADFSFVKTDGIPILKYGVTRQI